MAEIHSKIINCTSCGKYFDAVQGKCPYCGTPAPAENFQETIDPDASASVKKMSETIDPDNDKNNVGSGNFIHTQPPKTEGRKFSVDPGNFPETQPIELWEDQNSSDSNVVPVVAWLVTLTGPYKGKEYRVHTENNFIGREKGDIVITGDGAISRELDSKISYIPDTNEFYIASIQGNNILKVNNTSMISVAPVALKPYDVITIGKTQFVFIPLCGPRFNWKDGVSDA